jgi:hypothetical protein
MDVTLFAITSLSLILAAIMSVVAWRMSREERRRSDARVAALAAAIDGGERELRPAGTLLSLSGSAVSQGQRFAAAAALGVFVVGAAAAFAVVLGGGSRHVSAPAVASADAPLELLALEHDRDGDRLTVRGIVRNPAASATIDGLAAVVSVFSRDGRLIASGRAAVAVPALTPGTETPFLVSVPVADTVDRYRVSFRTDDRVVPHLDRRAQGVMARVQ